MEVVQVLHMNGGIDETSYANNSPIQECYSNYNITLPRSLAIADLGCSSGPKTLSLVSELIKVVDKLRQKLGMNHLQQTLLTL
ncbi:salicylate carboxymethyltransferase [Quercus suber]|uniref:Salicylate carboxymethyltransferase n=1 Tax=Quercus suber TaxID=58331 RepID=A0AAW0M7L1_QUESU